MPLTLWLIIPSSWWAATSIQQAQWSAEPKKQPRVQAPGKNRTKGQALKARYISFALARYTGLSALDFFAEHSTLPPARNCLSSLCWWKVSDIRLVPGNCSSFCFEGAGLQPRRQSIPIKAALAAEVTRFSALRLLVARMELTACSLLGLCRCPDFNCDASYRFAVVERVMPALPCGLRHRNYRG